ncbi:hypothetical protein IKZ40_05660 [bacterium]|nr:hypothetical protein [bacterium]
MTKAKGIAYVVFAALSLAVCALSLQAEEEAKGQEVQASQEIGMPAITQAIHRITLDNWTPKKFEQLALAVSTHPPYAYYVMALTQWMVNNYDGEKIKEESWCSMVGLQRWCTFLHAHRAELKDLDQRFVSYIMSNRDFTENFFEVYSSKDDLNNVMRLLQEFYLQRKDTFPKYNKLAIALAIVWDQPPSAKPHGQVPDSAVVPNDDTDLQRYDFWVKSNEHGDIDCNFTKTDPVYIKFIINAPAPISELEWAQKHTHYTRTRLGNAYGSIHYVYERVEKSQFSWPHEIYSLKEIKKRGGICCDQAYYASTVGKACGIPTLYFGGAGRVGWHAWLGYLKGDDNWDLECGRYASQNYVVGHAQDPQTKENLSDHQLLLLTDDIYTKSDYKQANRMVYMSHVFSFTKYPERALEIIDNAIKLAPKNVYAWNFKTQLLEKTNSTNLIAHLDAMIGQFRYVEDITSACRQKLIKAARAAGNEELAVAMEKKIIDTTKRERYDLSLKVYRDKATQLMSEGKWKEAGEEVRKFVKKFNKESADCMSLTAWFVRAAINNGKADEAGRTFRHFKTCVDWNDKFFKQIRDMTIALGKEVDEASRQKSRQQSGSVPQEDEEAEEELD